MIKFFEDFTKYKSNTIDLNVWNVQTGGHGWGNRELQYYTKNSSNLFIDHEGLHIRAIKEQYGSNPYTSARINTLQSFMYGTIEFEIKLPYHKGAWPAIWLLGDEIKEKRNWPGCGEIDLMEARCDKRDEIHFSLHNESYNHLLNNHRTFISKTKNNEYVKIKVKWSSEGFIYYIDDEEVGRFNSPKEKTHDNWNFDQPFFLIMNFAVGGYFSDYPDDSYEGEDFIIKYIIIEEE